MIGRWKENKDVIPCSEKVEPGYFFGPGGGSIMVMISKLYAMSKNFFLILLYLVH